MIAPRTLFGKLLLLFLGFGAAMAGVFIFTMSVEHERYHLQFDQVVNRRLAAEYVASSLLKSKPPFAAAKLEGALQRIAAIDPDVDLYVLDARGRILDASLPPGKLRRRRVDTRQISSFLRGQASLPLFDDDPASARAERVFSVAPLSIPGSAAAYLYVVLDRRNGGALAERLRTLYDVIEDAGIALAAALLAVLGSVVFLRMLTRRLGALREDMQRFHDEQLTVGACGPSDRDPLPDDEIGRLRHAFMQLTECIRKQVRELAHADEARREFLANISHELRTPLATLQLQLETLALEGDLPEAERRKCLAVGLDQAGRLARLTDQLIELAKLDARQVIYAPENFQLLELVQDAVLTHEPAAGRAGVTLTVGPPPRDVPLVVGDIGLVERVLGILLENAVRHAGVGGRVAVDVNADPERVRISVHDTGPGIPETERPRIFEQFYRGDRSRSRDTGQAGLGLATARAILDLHGRSIDFVSPPGEGTTFFFDLSVAPDAKQRPERARRAVLLR